MAIELTQDTPFGKVGSYIVCEGGKHDRTRLFGENYANFVVDIKRTDAYRECLTFYHQFEPDEKSVDLQMWETTPTRHSLTFYSDTNQDNEVDFVISISAKTESELDLLIDTAERKEPTAEQREFYRNYMQNLVTRLADYDFDQ
jgi:hypothetical protein